MNHRLRSTDDFLYQQLVDMLQVQMDNGTMAPGDRLPSLRRLSQQMDVSVPTVRQAYLELERLGRISARPKSGYFVAARQENPLVKPRARASRPQTVRCRKLLDRVYDAIHQPGVLPLGIANPCMALPATKALHRTMKRVMNRAEERGLSYAPTLGDPGLRRQIAQRYLRQFGVVDMADIIISNGAQEALALALQATVKAGDIVAVESPAYHGHLELIETLGMLAVEIETCPLTGVSLNALEQSLKKHDIKACVFSSAINNPLGSLSRQKDRRAMVALLEEHDIPLIEDDVYGELVYAGQRPLPAQYFSTKGLVLTCSSFAKTVSPGYRIGWLLPGKFHDEVHKLKRAISCSSGLIPQLTLADYMASGDYDRHIKRLLPILKSNAQRMACHVQQTFPAETRISRPQGGSVLWLELNAEVDSGHFFDHAIDAGISIMPGAIFSAGSRYRHYLRLSYGHPWSVEIEQGIQTLGQLAYRLSAT